MQRFEKLNLGAIMAKKAPPSILQLLKECETAQSIFQDMMIVSLPQDFPLKYRILLEEICQALGSFRNKENIETIRSVCSYIKNQAYLEHQEYFWETLIFLWNLAKESFGEKQLTQKKLMGIKSGQRRREKQDKIKQELAHPLEIALQKLNEVQRKRGYKKIIINEILDDFSDKIEHTMKKYSSWKDKERFFTYYLDLTINKAIASGLNKNSTFHFWPEQRKPRTPESKQNSRRAALLHNQQKKTIRTK